MPNIVALSTGHSRKDTGAISTIDGTPEYVVNCAIVDHMERIGLHNGEFEMIDTPFEDEPYPDHLVHTVKAINARRFDFLCCVEIHHNSSVNKNVRGAEAVYWDESVLGRELAGYIAGSMSMVRLVYSRPIRQFWRQEQQHYYQSGAIATWKHLRRRLWYLSKALIPAVIVEVGYLSNERDMKLIHTRQKQNAAAINAGIVQWITFLNHA